MSEKSDAAREVERARQNLRELSAVGKETTADRDRVKVANDRYDELRKK